MNAEDVFMLGQLAEDQVYTLFESDEIGNDSLCGIAANKAALNGLLADATQEHHSDWHGQGRNPECHDDWCGVDWYVDVYTVRK